MSFDRNFFIGHPLKFGGRPKTYSCTYRRSCCFISSIASCSIMVHSLTRDVEEDELLHCQSSPIKNLVKSVYWLLLGISILLCQTSCPLRTVHLDLSNGYQMELRLSFSQQLAKGLRGGGHQLTDLYVSLIHRSISV